MRFNEGRHKPGCTCGFCQNMSKLKKGSGSGGKPEEKKKDDDKEVTAESIVRRLLDN